VANDPLNPTPPPPVAGDPLTVLERFETAVAGLRAGLLDLEASPSFLMLTGDELGPVTAARVGVAADGAEDLWVDLQAADEALAEVRTHVELNGLEGGHRQEVIDRLSERWVSISGSTRSIGELVDGVRQRYDRLRPHVAEIDQLWLAILPRLDAAKATLARLESDEAGLGVPEPLVGRARALAADLEQRLVADPLSVAVADGDRLDAQVAEAAEQVASLLASRESLDEDVAQTGGLLASLRVLRARAEAAASRAEAKVVDPAGLVRVPSDRVLDGPGGLTEQLDHFFSLGDEVSWNQRRGLLDNWLSTARRLEDQLARALEANSAPLTARDELRGRLRAYQAKIAAVGKAEDLELTALVDEARAELYTAPTDLGAASATIEELARSLRP
jgi:phage shock protein A